MAQWFCQINGKQVGPLSPAKLVEMVRAGKIKAETPVRKDDSQWVTAQSVNGLFESAGKKLPQPRCPYCGVTVAALPTTCPNCQRRIESTPYDSSV